MSRRRPLQGPAVAFGLLGSLFFACGGRTDIDLDDDPTIIGNAGASGAKGGTAGASGSSAGKAGMGNGTSQGGAAAAGGSTGGTSGNNGGTAGSAGKGKGGSSTGTGGKDLFDSGIPIPDSGPIGECTGCLQDKCKSSINACYNNPKCLSGIQCAITQCLAGGGQGQGGMGQGQGGMNGGTQCLLMCFDGDLGAGLAAIQAFQCISQQCGDQCIPQGGPQGAGGAGGNPFGGGGASQGGMTGGPMGGPPQGGMTGGGTPPNPGGAEGAPGEMYMEGIRVPMPEEAEGFPELQDALRRP